jgi:hypothetical protein
MSPLNVMLLRQCLQERYAQRRLGIGRPAAEIANERHLRLLRTRRERPRCRAAKQRDELASFHLPDHSTTSSASASNLSGGVMHHPDALPAG